MSEHAFFAWVSGFFGFTGTFAWLVEASPMFTSVTIGSSIMFLLLALYAYGVQE